MVKHDPTLPGLATVLKRIQGLHGTKVLVGITGQHAASGDASAPELVEIATAQEFGTVTIPPRPFLRTSLKRNRRRWTGILRPAIRSARSGDGQATLRVLRRTGVVMVGDTQATLRKGPWIPNAPLTIARKGSSQPLVDTGQLVQSIRALVEHPGARSVVVG